MDRPDRRGPPDIPPFFASPLWSRLTGRSLASEIPV